MNEGVPAVGAVLHEISGLSLENKVMWCGRGRSRTLLLDKGQVVQAVRVPNLSLSLKLPYVKGYLPLLCISLVSPHKSLGVQRLGP